jgi:hypothetical protein
MGERVKADPGALSVMERQRQINTSLTVITFPPTPQIKKGQTTRLGFQDCLAVVWAAHILLWVLHFLHPAAQHMCCLLCVHSHIAAADLGSWVRPWFPPSCLSVRPSHF